MRCPIALGCLLIVACSDRKAGGGQDGPAAASVRTRYAATPILDALSSGALTEADAQVYLWSLLLGAPEGVPDDYKTIESDGSVQPPHLLLGRAATNAEALSAQDGALAELVATFDEPDGGAAKDAIPSPDASDYAWCRYGVLAGGAIDLLLQKADEPCVWDPATGDAITEPCVGGAYSGIPDCSELVPPDAILPAAATAAATLAAALGAADAAFRDKVYWSNPAVSPPTRVYALADAYTTWSQAVWGQAQLGSSGRCLLFINATPPSQAEQSDENLLRSTAVHEYFHCVQFFKGLFPALNDTTWAIESTATWTEDYVGDLQAWPNYNTEHIYVEEYPTLPGQPVLETDYEPTFVREPLTM